MRAAVLAVFLLTVLVAGFSSSGVRAQDSYTAEPLKEAPPSGEVSEEVAKLLEPTGIRVSRGTRKICDIWLCKEWSLPKFDPGANLLYPFQPGQILGVVLFHRKSSDFRQQDIGKGLYTMRYGQQPEDGNHVGTSPTRDFVLLIEVSKDKSPEPLDYKALTTNSAEAAGGKHPCLLYLGRPEPDRTDAIRNESDWWIVRLVGKGKVDAEVKDLPVELIVVGHAKE